MLQLTEIAAFLDRFFDVARYDDDQGGVLHVSPRAVRRIGPALEPWPGLRSWTRSAQLDALFPHRFWKLDAAPIDQDVGVLAYHLAFDERMTLGYNPRLADALGLAALEALGEKGGRPLGMIGDVPRPALARRW